MFLEFCFQCCGGLALINKTTKKRLNMWMFDLNFEAETLGPGSCKHLCSCVGDCGISGLVWGVRALSQKAENLAYPHLYCQSVASGV